MKRMSVTSILLFSVFFLTGCELTTRDDNTDTNTITLGAPSSLSSVVNGDNDVVLTWVESTDTAVTGYSISRSTSASSGFAVISSVAKVATYTDEVEGLTLGTTYFYAIRSKDDSGNFSEFTSTSSATPGGADFLTAPQGLAVSAGHLRNTLSWTANTQSNLSGYVVQRKLSGASTFSTLAEVGTVTSYTDDLVAGDADKTYVYSIKAKNADDELSDASSEVSALIKNGATLYAVSCFTCHTGAPHATNGALLEITSAQSKSFWSSKFTRMRNKSTINQLRSLSDTEVDALVDYLHRANNNAL